MNQTNLDPRTSEQFNLSLASILQTCLDQPSEQTKEKAFEDLQQISQASFGLLISESEQESKQALLSNLCELIERIEEWKSQPTKAKANQPLQR